MILRQFPDIEMVRRLKNDPAKPGNTWMNVALNIKCKEVSRTGVESPYSLFINRTGFSYCNVNRRQYRIETDMFLLAQPGDIYDLTIDNVTLTEICNIHINKQFFEQVGRAWTTPSEILLDRPEECNGSMHHFFTQLIPKDAVLQRITDRLSTMNTTDTDEFEVLLSDIIAHLFHTKELTRLQIASLPFIRKSVRDDIHRRLCVARDYISSNYQAPINLERICRETGMSKFHFLRIFKSFYGVTPYQFLSNVRMQKAADLLKTTRRPISTIADDLGFAYPNSFIKAFHKTYGTSPLQFRK